MTPCKLQRDKEEYSLIMLSNPIEDALLDKSRCYFKRVWFQNCQHIKTKKTTQHNCLSTLNIHLILWHTQSNVCAENVKSWIKSWVIAFTFQACTLPYIWNCICVSLFRFHI